MEENRITLTYGRRLAYLDLGVTHGQPVIHMHGAPSSKRETALFDLDGAASRLGLRLLAVDRPGIGGSDPLPRRRLLDWPADVAAFADALGFDRFAVFGYSMGAASALACLHRIPKRLSGVLIVSGLGHPKVPGAGKGRSPDVAAMIWAARHAPLLADQVLRFMRYGTRNPDKMIAAASRGLPPADRGIAERAEMAGPFAAFFADALRQGPRRAREDIRLAASPWGFLPGPTDVPVHIWHGSADRNVPVAAAHWLAEQIPTSNLRIEEGAGHLSLLADRTEEILSCLSHRLEP